MNKADAIAYRERWREVERIERLEAQLATIQDRWRHRERIQDWVMQFATLLEMPKLWGGYCRLIDRFGNLL